MPADLRARVLVALPAAGIAVALCAIGGWAFALPLAVLGAFAAAELHIMSGPRGRAWWAGGAAVAALPLAALAGGRHALIGALWAALAALFLVWLASGRRRDVLPALGVSALAVWWIGLALAHGVLLRQEPHGFGLLMFVLVGTFIGDTAAHLLGSAWGRRPLAPRISPRKTVEGLVAGVIVGTGSVVAVAVLWQDWLGAAEAVVLGAAIAVAAPVGDLFESLLKRDAGVKDSGRAFGPHGGVLDRIDALLFAAPAAYYVSLALL